MDLNLLSRPPANSVLVVDDDPLLLTVLREKLASAGFEVSAALSGEEALAVLRDRPVHVVVSDARMPGMSGVELLSQVRRDYPAVQRLLLTGVSDPQAAADAINEAGVFRFLLKPCGASRLVETVRAACEQFDMQEQHRRLVALCVRQNEELAEHAATLEARIHERTQLLSRAKAEWERTFDAIERPIAVIERDCRVVRANLAYARLADRPIHTIPGRTCHSVLFKRGTPCPECQLAGRGAATAFELAGPRTFSVATTETDGRLVCIYRETTQERLQLRQMVQTEKLAAVGILAGGVAHEINNPLGAILAFVQLMLREDGRSDEDVETLRDVEHATLRCKRIVESLLRFSRRGAAAKKAFELNKAVEETSVLFGPQLKCQPRASLDIQLAPELLTVAGDSNEIEQVILNLLMNALQALPKSGGKVGLLTRRVDGTAEVLVQDDGVGIAPENRSKIFDLGFTTKPPGEGTGFGLSISWAIAQAHGGRLDFESEPGRGTTFTLRLPLAAEAAAPTS